MPKVRYKDTDLTMLHKATVAVVSLVFLASGVANLAHAENPMQVPLLQNLPGLGNTAGSVLSRTAGVLAGPGAGSGPLPIPSHSLPAMNAGSSLPLLPQNIAVPLLSSPVLSPGSTGGSITTFSNSGNQSGLLSLPHQLLPVPRAMSAADGIQGKHSPSSNSVSPQLTNAVGSKSTEGANSNVSSTTSRGVPLVPPVPMAQSPPIYQAPVDKMPGLRILNGVAASPNSGAGFAGNRMPVMIPREGTTINQSGPGSFKLESGLALLVVHGAPATVSTTLGNIDVHRTADVLISMTDGVLRVQNLDAAHNGVQVHLNQTGTNVAVGPGFELVASATGLTREVLAPVDGLARRNQVISSTGMLAVSEIQLASVIQNQLKVLDVGGTTRLVGPVVDRVLKTAAIMDLTRGVVGFVTGALPVPLPPVLTPPPVAPPPVTPPPVLPPSVPPLVAPGDTGLASGNGQSTSSQASTVTTLTSRLNLAQIVSPAAFDATKNIGRPTNQDRPIPPPLPGNPANHQTEKEPHSNVEKPAERTPLGSTAQSIGTSNSLPPSPQESSLRAGAPEPAANSKTERPKEKIRPVPPRHKTIKSPEPPNAGGEVLATVRETIRRFPELVMAVLLLIAALLILSLALARSAIVRSRQLEAMNRRLETEVAERRLIEQKVTGLVGDLQQRIVELDEVNDALHAARDQAVEASRLKSQFVANISHEIRTPISAVIGMNQILLASPLDAKQREYARLVNESAQSLLTVINDILDFSKIEAGMIDLTTVTFSPETLLKEVSDVVSSAVRQKGLLFLTSIGRDVPTALQGDATRLRQVLVNLAGNAVKFTQHGEVVVQVSTLTSRPGAVLFSVQDTGIGVSAEAQTRLFQPFVQADGTTTRRFGGTGLGLSISKRLVELMGGTLQMKSAGNSGSTFSFEVPLYDPATTTETTDQPAGAMPPLSIVDGASDSAVKATSNFLGTGVKSASCESRRVLICSDHLLSRDLLREQLEAVGFLANVIDERALLENLKPKQTLPADWCDIVVVDTITCGKAASAIKSCPGTASTPVIGIFSGRDDDDDSSYDAFLTSPINAHDVVRWVVSVLKHEMLSATAAVAVAQIPPQLAAPPAVSSATILIAEDSPVLQQMLQLLFDRLGYVVNIVGNGREAVEAAARGNYSVIFMDWQMPEMDGLEAVRVIRQAESQKGGHTPIIAMTANAMQGDRDTCLAAGMDDYISKPFTFEELRTMVTRWLPKINADEKTKRDSG